MIFKYNIYIFFFNCFILKQNSQQNRCTLIRLGKQAALNCFLFILYSLQIWDLITSTIFHLLNSLTLQLLLNYSQHFQPLTFVQTFKKSTHFDLNIYIN